MRRALVILISFLIMFGVGALTYNAYMNHEQKMEIGQLVSRNKTLTSDGKFTAQYRCELHGKQLSSYTYEVENGDLYITLYASSSERNLLEQDKDGYSDIEITTGQKIRTVYYRYKDKTTELTYKQSLRQNGFTYRDCALDENGKFTGKFRCELTDKYMSSFTYKVEGDEMYITLYASKKNAMEKDEDGYALVEIDSKKNINKVYFRYNNEKLLLAELDK